MRGPGTQVRTARFWDATWAIPVILDTSAQGTAEADGSRKELCKSIRR